MTQDREELIACLRSKKGMTVCPYDPRSPDYWTTNDTDPCKFCGQLNDDAAPDVCKGVDLRVMDQAADTITSLLSDLEAMQEALKEAEAKAERVRLANKRYRNFVQQHLPGLRVSQARNPLDQETRCRAGREIRNYANVMMRAGCCAREYLVGLLALATDVDQQGDDERFHCLWTAQPDHHGGG
ncbi:hypothetical protein KOAAANKH_02586 [Brevundimonas sp. NIBR10]|uniref:hypothetical protein n=1 Tax=Brevundimonas sp. NIBR10 TaxID=3015997 RepID=UPI0022F1B678|nr:hypothetical protein [Brevundimonas sp. NIBR10]WGM47704.1 hypothetical protein KOAAANKH_02586 [Brevundimonas sp. NIBR10]